MSAPNTFNPAIHIQIAADSIEQLRNVDVERLFDQCQYDLHDKLAQYICRHRPDLSREVSTALAQYEYEVG